MRDTLDRPMRDLRISVTDRCNLRCRYCMPREVFGPDHAFLPREELLSFEEIARVARVMAGHGVRRIRLTGGEPLLRRGLGRLVELLAAIEGVEDLSLTTNGLLLARHAETLAAAGLDRVTVSLDALDPGVLRAVADAPLDARVVLEGIEAAAAAGLAPVKVNMVVRRGLNDGEIVAMAERFRGTGQVLRFIEYMDVGTTNGWRREQVVPAAEILELLGSRWPLEPLAPAHPGEVASRWRYRDGAGEIGLIHAVTAPFCHGCTTGAPVSRRPALHLPVRRRGARPAHPAARRRRGRRARRDSSAASGRTAATATPPNARRSASPRRSGSRCPTSGGDSVTPAFIGGSPLTRPRRSELAARLAALRNTGREPRTPSWASATPPAPRL